MKIIKLYSLNLSFHDFLLVVYQQTGIDFVNLYNELELKYNLEILSDFKDIVFQDLIDYKIQLIRIFEDENRFRDTPFSKKDHKIKKMYDQVHSLLIDLRLYKIDLDIEKFEVDKERLQKISPSLHDYFKNLLKINLN